MFFKKNMKIGLALGGGAAKGLAHIGVLRLFDEIGLKPDIITGTSMGAIIGAMYSAGRTPDEIEGIAEGIDRKQAMKLFSVSLNGAGLIDGRKITQLLSTVIRTENIEDLPVPFGCTACSITDGREINFTKGNIIESLRSSISIPGIFSPVEKNGHALVDGGLVNPVPVDLARELGADIVIAVNVLNVPKLQHKSFEMAALPVKMENVDKELPINDRIAKFIEKELTNIEAVAKRVASIFDLTDDLNIVDIMSQTTHLAERNIAEYKLIADKPDIIIAPPMDSIKHFEFHKTSEAVLLGENEARKHIKELERFL